MRAVYVVPCGKTKVWDKHPDRGPAPAREVYVGPLATAARRYAERFHSGRWVILSARHGLLAPDDVVLGPYEVSFSGPVGEIISDKRLREQAVGRGFTDLDKVVVVAGRKYVERVAAALVGHHVTVVAPLGNVGGLGYMLRALKGAVETGRPLTFTGSR
jgi:hypothetical protein